MLKVQNLMKTILKKIGKSVVLLCFISVSVVKAETFHDNQHLEFWLQTLKEGSFIVLQKNAARQLGKIADQRARVELEYQGMHHESPEVRAEALYALGQMASMPSMAVLRRAIQQDNDPLVQKKARQAIYILNKRREYIKKL